MKRALLLLCAVAVATVSCSRFQRHDDPRVIVLGIDGGTWSMIEPMMEQGQLPNLRKLYDRGLHGVLESRPPILSPVVWTTIVTGFGFQKHGVKDWKTSQSVNRRVSAIWEILADQKKTVDVFNVPGSWPPDAVPPGVMLSGFPLSGATFAGNTGDVITRADLDAGKLPAAFRDNVQVLRDATASLGLHEWTPWLDAKVASRPSFRGVLRVYRLSDSDFYVTPLYRTDDGLVVSEPKALRSEISKKIGEPYIPEGPGWSKWAEDYTPEVLYDHLDQVFSIQSKAAAEYAAKDDWNLFLYVMTLVDRVSHPYWAYGHANDFPTLDPEKAKKYGSAVANAYKRSDEELGKILAKVKGDPYVMVISDHGFQSNTDTSKPIGTHNPDGIYIVAGPGISPKTGMPKFIEDVTPTLLYLLGSPVGQDMDGKVFSEVAEMLGREQKTVPTLETKHRASTDQPVDKSTWESLRGLGYVDGAAPRGADKKKPEGAADQAKPAPAAKDGAAPNALEDWPEAPPHAH